jgi:GT2 family glycosyltransferase
VQTQSVPTFETIVVGRVEPIWAASRPHWFPPEFDWVVGASYRGMPQAVTPVRNAWSNNMAIRRTVFLAVGGFRDNFGKTGERSRPEDTDLCLRATPRLGISCAGASTRAAEKPRCRSWTARGEARR